MSDQQITCNECGDVFAFTAAEQEFYAQKGLASPPKRCKACRQARKAAHGGPGGGGGGPSRGPRRFSNDVNEYRSPMTGGHDAWGRAPYEPQRGGGAPRGGGRDGDRRRAPQHDARGGGHGQNGFGQSRGQGQNGFGQPRPYEGRGGGQGQNGFGHSRPRGGYDGGGPARARPWAGNATDYRSPAFPDARSDRGWQPPSDEGGGRPQGFRGGHDGGNDRPRGPRPSRDRAAPSSGQQAQAPRAPRPPRPSFDITCVSCGAQAQVPFEPLEGRDVFCQECYRARRPAARHEDAHAANPPAAHAESAAMRDDGNPDAGIVE